VYFTPAGGKAVRSGTTDYNQKLYSVRMNIDIAVIWNRAVSSFRIHVNKIPACMLYRCVSQSYYNDYHSPHQNAQLCNSIKT
jgi:hypothetical protein